MCFSTDRGDLEIYGGSSSPGQYSARLVFKSYQISPTILVGPPNLTSAAVPMADD